MNNEIVKKIVDRFCKIESVLTLSMDAVFCALCLRGTIGAEMFMTVFTVVVGFYFAHKASSASARKE